jgi:chorismate mutase
MVGDLASERYLARLTEDDLATLRKVLTREHPLGPITAEQTFREIESAQLLFDRENLIDAQVHSRRAYIIGRKGAGKTAFLHAPALANRTPLIVLRESELYAEFDALLKRHSAERGQLYVDQLADIWEAIFDHVALAYACNSASKTDPARELQLIWQYMAEFRHEGRPEHTVARSLMHKLQARLFDGAAHIGVRQALDELDYNGISYRDARLALPVVLAQRAERIVIVMDNLEDLHLELSTVSAPLRGLLRSVSRCYEERDQCPFDVQVCLPAELFDMIHSISANPEKDLQGMLTIHWKASELLHLVAVRYHLYMATNHPEELGPLELVARGLTESDPHVAILRAALPRQIENGLGIPEDPIGYILRHTQLLPRHAIEIVNSILTASTPTSQPWNVTPEAILAGTRLAETVLVEGVLSGFLATFPDAKTALRRLSRLRQVRFTVSALHSYYNEQGLRRDTGLDFEDLLTHFFEIGALGVFTEETDRYYEAQFQYTHSSALTAVEGEDELCVHPLFTRYVLEQSIPHLRREGSRVTYPRGSDPSDDNDYRVSLGYLR